MDDESVCLRHEPCPNCGSRDNLARYSDGHGYCFGCSHYEPGEGETPQTTRRNKVAKDLLPIQPDDYQPLRKRRISEDTCRHFSYATTNDGGKVVQVAYYRDLDGNAVGQKLRDAKKNITWKGNASLAQPLWGMHLFNKGKRVVITEGEIDAMTVSQVQGNRWPVVSVKGGAGNAHKDVAKALDWLRGFDEIVLWFDNDDAGRQAIEKTMAVLPVGKVKVANTPDGFKDANEMLVGGRADDIMVAVWEAKSHRPDGMVNLSEIIEDVAKPIEWGMPYWDERLTKATYGRRLGEAVGLGAGTGVGKTDWITQQITYDVTVLNEKVGLFILEQNPSETGKRLAGKFAGKTFHIPDTDHTREELVEAVTQVAHDDRVELYDHFGQADWEVIRENIRFLNKSEGIRIFYLDHLTALAAGHENERETLEEIMAEIGGLVKELNIWLLFVSHLATPDGKPHEEGGRVMIRHFKGARAIGFWSHFMFGMERDQQAEDEEEKTTTTFRILKDRYTGRSTGLTMLLGFDQDTGRLVPKEFVEDDDDDCPF